MTMGKMNYFSYIHISPFPSPTPPLSRLILSFFLFSFITFPSLNRGSHLDHTEMPWLYHPPPNLGLHTHDVADVGMAAWVVLELEKALRSSFNQPRREGTPASALLRGLKDLPCFGGGEGLSQSIYTEINRTSWVERNTILQSSSQNPCI